VRRQPLGSDRFNRCYWWGLAGSKDALLLQQEAGAADATLGLLAAAAVEGAHAAAASTLMAGAFGGKQQDAAAAAGSSGGSAGKQLQQRASEGAGAVTDHAGLLLPRGAEAWALLEGPEAVESLMGYCEVRGVREKELKASLDKVGVGWCGVVLSVCVCGTWCCAACQAGRQWEGGQRPCERTDLLTHLTLC
jgi:hypothetical protein